MPHPQMDLPDADNEGGFGMKNAGFIFKNVLLILVLTFLFSTAVHADTTYWFTLSTSNDNGYEHAYLTAEDANGRQVWSYSSGYYPVTELSHFQMILNNGAVYLVENGSIKSLDFFTGRVLWTNSDFGGSPADGCYTFSSSGKLYISGYYGPDLFVVDPSGRTVCRVNELCPGSYWMESMWWYGGDDMRVYYGSDSTLFTFNVLDYVGRMDGIY